MRPLSSPEPVHSLSERPALISTLWVRPSVGTFPVPEFLFALCVIFLFAACDSVKLVFTQQVAGCLGGCVCAHASKCVHARTLELLLLENTTPSRVLALEGPLRHTKEDRGCLWPVISRALLQRRSRRGGGNSAEAGDCGDAGMSL